MTSIKEYRKKKKNDKKRLEQFYKSVDKNIIQELNSA